MEGALFEIMRQGFRALILAGLPVLIATSLAGILVGVLQSATSVHDSASAYAVRVLAFALVIYLMYETFWRTLISLFEFALR